MKVAVSVIFPRKHYVEGKFRKNMFIEYLAKKYNSTGSLVRFKDDDPQLWCLTPKTLIDELIRDCHDVDDKIRIKISPPGGSKIYDQL